MRLLPARPPSWVGELPLAQRERPLAWAAYDGGRLAATTHALWTAPDGAPPAAVFWDEIGKATWRDGRLTVQVLGGRTDTSYAVKEPGSLPRVLRERVTASIVYNENRRLSGGGSVRVVARRRGGEAELRWQLVFERPADADDPLARAEADRFVAAARDSLA